MLGHPRIRCMTLLQTVEKLLAIPVFLHSPCYHSWRCVSDCCAPFMGSTDAQYIS